MELPKIVGMKIKLFEEKKQKIKKFLSYLDTP